MDKDGNLCPNADNLVKFTISGRGFIAGVDNGSQTSMEKFKASERKAFYGKCMAIIQSSKTKGTINLTAEAEGLQNNSIKIKVK